MAALEARIKELEAKVPGSDPVRDAQSYLQTKTAEINAQVPLAIAELLKQEGMTEENAQLIVGTMRQAALTQVQAEAQRQALLPAARQTVAERIAKEFSVGNVVLEANDLLEETSVDGMRARAKTLAEVRRDSNYQQRVTKRIDSAESGVGNGGFDPKMLDNLSPSAIIKLGIQRGHGR